MATTIPVRPGGAWALLQERCAALEAERDALRAETSAQAARLRDAQAAQAALAQELADARAEAGALRADRTALEADRARRGEELAASRTAHAEEAARLRQRIVTVELQAARLRGRCEEADGFAEEQGQLKEDADKALAGRAEELRDLAARLKGAEEKAQAGTLRERKLQKEKEALEEQRDQHIRHSELLLKDKYRLLDQIQRKDEIKAELVQRLGGGGGSPGLSHSSASAATDYTPPSRERRRPLSSRTNRTPRSATPQSKPKWGAGPAARPGPSPQEALLEAHKLRDSRKLNL